jgi:hypothetical protein
MILIPMYVHPLEDPVAWQPHRFVATDATLIINVHDGPGKGPDSTYLEVTRRLDRAGVPMLGYVDLDYGARLEGEVRRDILGWSPYPVGGVFFDRAPSGSAAVDYVAQVVRAVQGTVVLNPGTNCHVAYSALADLVCTFEGSWSEYRKLDPEPDRSNAVHLVYGVPAAELAQAQALVESRVGHGLATDLDLPLPYAGLPSALRQAVRSA